MTAMAAISSLHQPRQGPRVLPRRWIYARASFSNRLQESYRQLLKIREWALGVGEIAGVQDLDPCFVIAIERRSARAAEVAAHGGIGKPDSHVIDLHRRCCRVFGCVVGADLPS